MRKALYVTHVLRGLPLAFSCPPFRIPPLSFAPRCCYVGRGLRRYRRLRRARDAALRLCRRADDVQPGLRLRLGLPEADRPDRGVPGALQGSTATQVERGEVVFGFVLLLRFLLLDIICSICLSYFKLFALFVLHVWFLSLVSLVLFLLLVLRTVCFGHGPSASAPVPKTGEERPFPSSRAPCPLSFRRARARAAGRRTSASGRTACWSSSSPSGSGRSWPSSERLRPLLT